jgi:alanine dehydrogenase
MRIAVPTEVKNNEFRVAMTPAGVRELTRAGHEVLVQAGAGSGSAIPDDEYATAGARIVPDADSAWGGADLVCKVKEPVADEYRHLRDDLVLFTYLHLAADEACTRALLDARTTAVAYETVQVDDGSLPLLAPMSEVAGRLAIQVGAYFLLRSVGGRGVLMGGVPGVRPARVVVLGGGTAGRNAAQIAVGMRAEVAVVDLSAQALRAVDTEFAGTVRTVRSSALAIEQEVLRADLVVGAVLVPGARAPHLVTNDLVAAMQPGSVLVDIAVDQGGCFEDTRPTTHADPTYQVHGSTFYAVANMPGSVPVTSTQALAGVTLPYLLALVSGDDCGRPGDAVVATLRKDRHRALARGLTTHDGHLVNAEVAAAHGLEAVAVL